MICTGTGSAPFRAFIERHRRAMPQASGNLQLFFGARCPGELPYFGLLQKLPPTFLGQHLCFSRVADQPKMMSRMPSSANVSWLAHYSNRHRRTSSFAG